MTSAYCGMPNYIHELSSFYFDFLIKSTRTLLGLILVVTVCILTLIQLSGYIPLHCQLQNLAGLLFFVVFLFTRLFFILSPLLLSIQVHGSSYTSQRSNDLYPCYGIVADW